MVKDEGSGVKNLDAQKFWYVLQVRSGAEKSVVENIKRIALKKNVSDLFDEFNVPTIDVAKHGTAKATSKVLCSGYVFVKMYINDLSLSVINEMSGAGTGNRLIISFLPKARIPQALSEKEYQDMLATIMKSSNSQLSVVSFTLGMDVKIRSGSFKGFKGTIIGVHKEKSLLDVSVSVFNRETPVEVSFDDVEVVNTN